jgi:hypothetical protein
MPAVGGIPTNGGGGAFGSEEEEKEEKEDGVNDGLIDGSFCSGTKLHWKANFETRRTLYRFKDWNQALSSSGSTAFNLYSPTA